jgi:hypothetical protein
LITDRPADGVEIYVHRFRDYAAYRVFESMPL